MSKTIQVFCNKSILFKHPKDSNIEYTIKNHVFEVAPQWIVDTDIFKALKKDNDIKVISTAKDLKAIEVSGKAVQDKIQQMDDVEVDVEQVIESPDVAEEVQDLGKLTNKQLYKLCVEKNIEVEERKNKAYYLDKLSQE